MRLRSDLVGSSERNAMRDVADALSYLHHECSLPIVDCDISSKNTLLDEDYDEAHVSDCEIYQAGSFELDIVCWHLRI